jgi:hypothetical protein
VPQAYLKESSQSTDRSARTVIALRICRSILRRHRLPSSPAAALPPTAAMSVDRTGIRRFAGLFLHRL